MSKFNFLKRKNDEAEVVTNYMGAKAVRYEDEMALVGMLLTSMVEDKYYESNAEQMNRLRTLIARCDKVFVAKAAIYARTQFGMRSITHVVAAELAKYAGGEIWAKAFYNRLVHRPDDMTETLAYYFANCCETGQNKVPNAVKKGFAAAFDRFDGYQLAKYRGESHAVKLIDVVNLVRPRPVAANAESLKALVNDTLRSDNTWESELTKAGQTAQNEDEKAELKNAAWSKLIGERRIGYFALLRNLRNIMEQAPDMVAAACTMLTDERLIRKSLVLPFRFLSAYEEVEKLATTVLFEKDNANVGRVLTALEKAVTVSVANLPVLGGKTVILSDNSGSMTGDRGGHSLVSKMSNRKSSDIANLFAVLYWLKADNTLVGLFGDHLITPKLDRSKGVFENFKTIDAAKNSCGPGTERGIFDMFERLLNEKIKADSIVIFSDCQIGDGCNWYDNKGNRGGDFMKLFARYRTFNPAFRCYSVDLKGYSTTVFDDSVIKIAGFSDKIFDIMKVAEMDKLALVNAIQAVDLGD